MKSLNLAISLEGLKLGDSEQKPTDICSAVIKNVIMAYGNQQKGLNEEERRKFYKISDALEAVKEDGIVSLEDDWMGFIRKCFKEAKLPPDNLLRRVEEKVAEVKDR